MRMKFVPKPLLTIRRYLDDQGFFDVETPIWPVLPPQKARVLFGA